MASQRVLCCPFHSPLWLGNGPRYLMWLLARTWRRGFSFLQMKSCSFFRLKSNKDRKTTYQWHLPCFNWNIQKHIKTQYKLKELFKKKNKNINISVPSLVLWVCECTAHDSVCVLIWVWNEVKVWCPRGHILWSATPKVRHDIIIARWPSS